VDRTVKDLQSQLDRKDKQNGQLQDDLGRMRDKLDKLLKSIDDLQAADSAHQLNARRAERDLREEREERLRLERELEGWKSMRLEKNGSSSGPNSVAGSVIGGYSGARRNTGPLNGVGSLRHSVLGLASAFEGAYDEPNGVEIPKRKSSISRVPSLTKGFL
jgi:myosin protein heavy chain